MAQVFLIGYVSFVVPLRTCYDIMIDAGDTAFWIDLFVDLFFITDLVLNFRTAYYEEWSGTTGRREGRPRKIAMSLSRQPPTP